jgi:hypothetical protein
MKVIKYFAPPWDVFAMGPHRFVCTNLENFLCMRTFIQRKWRTMVLIVHTSIAKTQVIYLHWDPWLQQGYFCPWLYWCYILQPRIEQLQPTYRTFIFNQLQYSPCLNQKALTNIWWFQIPFWNLILLID